jgi:predicted DNA-binding WGR domain protein
MAVNTKIAELKYQDDKSDKVYQIEVQPAPADSQYPGNTNVEIKYGRRGSNLRTQNKIFSDIQSALDFARSKETEKRNNGYVDESSKFISTRRASKANRSKNMGSMAIGTDSFMSPKVMKAKRWAKKKKNDGLKDFRISEKLDGFRAVWDGEKFVSKDGLTFDAPEWFTSGLPRNIKLDGELWTGRGGWNDVASIARTKKESPNYDESRWADVQYMIFDSPTLNEFGRNLKREEGVFDGVYNQLIAMSEPQYPGHEMVLAFPYKNLDDKAYVFNRNLKSAGKYQWTKAQLIEQMRALSKPTGYEFPDESQAKYPMHKLIDLFEGHQQYHMRPPFYGYKGRIPNTPNTFFFDSESQIKQEGKRQSIENSSIKPVQVEYVGGSKEYEVGPYMSKEHDLTIDRSVAGLNEISIPGRYRVVPNASMDNPSSAMLREIEVLWEDQLGANGVAFEDIFQTDSNLDIVGFKKDENGMIIPELVEYLLQRIVKDGGEGAMLRRKDGVYEMGNVQGTRRSSNIYKVKPRDTEEGILVGFEEGLGRNEGRVGSFILKHPNIEGKTWKLGSGLADPIRERPPPIGSEIEYEFTGRTSSGIPKEASFLRVRKPSTWNASIRRINGKQFREVGRSYNQFKTRAIANLIRQRTNRNVRVIPKAKGYSLYLGNVRKR